MKEYITSAFALLGGGLSLVENAGHMGLKIPKKLADAIEELVGMGEGGGEHG